MIKDSISSIETLRKKKSCKHVPLGTHWLHTPTCNFVYAIQKKINNISVLILIL